MFDWPAIAAIAGGVAAAVAGVLLAVFFATGNDRWGRANDAASAAFAILLIPVAIELGSRQAPVGSAAWLVAGIGLVAMTVAAVASVLTALGRLTVQELTVWQGGSFAGLFAWVCGASILMLPTSSFPRALSWLGIGAAVLALVATADIVRLVRRPGGMAAMENMTRPPPVAAGSALLAFAAVPAWCVWLGLSL